MSDRDARIHELRALGKTLTEIGAAVSLSGTRVGRILGSNGSTPRASAATPTYICGCCGRKLKNGAYVYSAFTGTRYCSPGPKGCNR
jgi:hypothetical protein